MSRAFFEETRADRVDSTMRAVHRPSSQVTTCAEDRLLRALDDDGRAVPPHLGESLQNYRPIAVMPTLYKILTRTMADAQTLTSLVATDQLFRGVSIPAAGPGAAGAWREVRISGYADDLACFPAIFDAAVVRYLGVFLLWAQHRCEEQCHGSGVVLGATPVPWEHR